MSEIGFLESLSGVDSITPTELMDRINADEDVFILDTRASSDYDDWRIVGDSVDSMNIPYFEFLTGEPDEEISDDIPNDETVIVVCAKGESSQYVASLLADHGYDVAHLERGMYGWASIYEYSEIETIGEVTVVQYQRPSSGCLAYLIVSDGDAAVIDPLRAFTNDYQADARAMGATIRYAIDTHIHADHISGVRRLASQTDADIVLPEPAKERGVEHTVDVLVTTGDELQLGATTIDVIHTPGHTTGMTSYRIGDIVFTGDGLFIESVARPDLEAGANGAPDAARQLYESLRGEFLSLPNEIRIAPAHFSDAATRNDDGTYTAQIGALGESMDALSMDPDEFAEFILSDMPPRPSNYEKIIAINLGEQPPDDASAFELELGPNNCAASQATLTGD